MKVIPAKWLFLALVIYMVPGLSMASGTLSAPLQSLIDRQVMGSLQAQTAQQMQGQLAVLEQLGYGNEFNLIQQGKGNQVVALQHGNNHAAQVMQVGDFNQIQLAQYGDAKNITIQQFGHSAAILIEQY